MTPEESNVVRSQGRKCVAEIQQALKCRPKPKWNAVVPPIIRKLRAPFLLLTLTINQTFRE